MTHSLHFQPLRRSHADCFAFPSLEGTPLPSPTADAPAEGGCSPPGMADPEDHLRRHGKEAASSQAAATQRPPGQPRSAVASRYQAPDRAEPGRAGPGRTEGSRTPGSHYREPTRGPGRIARSRTGCPHLLPTGGGTGVGCRCGVPRRRPRAAPPLFTPPLPPRPPRRPAPPPRP